MLRTNFLARSSAGLRSVSTTSATPLLRSGTAAPVCLLRQQQQQQQKRAESSVADAAATAGSHAISNPTLANIEKRWTEMPPQEQADLWMALRDRMKTNWAELTFQEKQAAYWIAFGPHGPRASDPPGEGIKVFVYTILGVIASGVLFATIRAFAKPPPQTMTKEWQEATNEYLKEQKTEPMTGWSMVQSKPGGKKD